MAWQLLGSAALDSGGELRLYGRADEFVIRVDGRELMTSRAHASEEALAEIGLRGLAARESPRVLIGGLGMGFTLAACLRLLPAAAEVAVAELVPEVVEWNRGPLARLSNDSLSDRRVSILQSDVASVIRQARAEYDAILLDVDNGPGDLSRAANVRLYTPSGLRAVLAALRPRGFLAIWSADPAPELAAQLATERFDVRVHRLAARGARDDPDHTILCAQSGEHQP